MYRTLFLLSILLANCQKDETISGYVDQNAEFRLIEMNGNPVTAKATIAFPQQGVVMGTAPCNSYSATQSAPMPWFEVGPIKATRRACPDLALETRYFELLSGMTLIESLADTIILQNDDGDELVFATPHP